MWKSGFSKNTATSNRILMWANVRAPVYYKDITQKDGGCTNKARLERKVVDVGVLENAHKFIHT